MGELIAKVQQKENKTYTVLTPFDDYASMTCEFLAAHVLGMTLAELTNKRLNEDLNINDARNIGNYINAIQIEMELGNIFIGEKR